MQVRIPAYDQAELGIRWETGSTISFATIVSYFKAFRDVCFSCFNAHPVKLGGPRKVIEIDEAVLVCRENSKVRLVPHQRCFGSTERGSNKCSIVAVDRRYAATVVLFVRQSILPVATIMSDKWAQRSNSA